ncbi:hypothetical protein NKH36_05595 [Mesorhizobium sp. M1312]|uniref:hypothetical protein n=1 Tax=unclassified Mesorhizobium TaxID=325217 RepID=UPI003336FFFD
MMYRSSMDESRGYRLKPVELPVRSFVPAKGLAPFACGQWRIAIAACPMRRTLAVF